MYATWISNLCLNNQHLVTQGKQQIRAGGGLIFSSFVRLTPTPPVNFIKNLHLWTLPVDQFDTGAQTDTLHYLASWF